MTTALSFIFVLGILVFVHELGHFITAKMAGVKVLEFGLGYPPKLWGVKRGETEYTINALPLGGFVRLLGEEDPSDPHSLAAQAAWKRLIVMAAGSFMNFVLAIVLFSVALMIPRELPAGRPQIVQVVPGSPAAQSGLQPGDIIYSVNGRTIDFAIDAAPVSSANTERSRSVALMPFRASATAAVSPPMPPPTMSTRPCCGPGFVIA